MKVQCKENSAKDWLDSLGKLGYSGESQCDIAIGESYTVYGMCLEGEALLYLLVGVGGRPAWYPAVLFEVRDTTLPSSWHFAFWGRDRSFRVKAVWGYSELINEECHFDALSEGDRQALEIFGERRVSIDAGEQRGREEKGSEEKREFRGHNT